MKGKRMKKLAEFVDEHKKIIALIAAGYLIYTFGYYKGYRSFEKVLVDTCKIINDDLTKF